MKILSPGQAREADAFTITNEPITSIELMERAAARCVEWITNRYAVDKKIKVFCGLGNNGGDGLAMARLLAGKGFSTEVFIVRHSEKSSADFKTNEALLENTSVTRNYLTQERIGFNLVSGDIVIDAIFGSGINSHVEGLAGGVIREINQSGCEVIAVDVPSGLLTDVTTPSQPLKEKNIVNATHTLTLHAPKLSFMFPSNAVHVGDFHVIDIGLHADFIKGLSVNNYFITKEDAHATLRPRQKFSHKGTHGHALLLCGSLGKMGAAVLAAKACLRAGVGMLTAHVPGCGNDIMQISVPEALTSADSCANFISDNILPSNYEAVGIGPGIGTEKETQSLLKLLVQNARGPLVLDADALNSLAENKTWIAFVPKIIILTPHPKVFERLAGKVSDDQDRYILQKEFSVKHGVYVVLKGAHTSISCPDGKFYFNSTGNPGMAKGGSGDVLTGMLTGLLAQGYSSLDTCVLGVYLHGLAGDIAASNLSEYSVLARDITDAIGEAFKMVEG